jgi:hypothetical protein
MNNSRKSRSVDTPRSNNIDSLRIVGTEESLEHWGWLFQILEEDGTIDIISHPDRTYEMRGSVLLRQYWQIRTRF